MNSHAWGPTWSMPWTARRRARNLQGGTLLSDGFKHILLVSDGYEWQKGEILVGWSRGGSWQTWYAFVRTPAETRKSAWKSFLPISSTLTGFPPSASTHSTNWASSCFAGAAHMIVVPAKHPAYSGTPIAMVLASFDRSHYRSLSQVVAIL